MQRPLIIVLAVLFVLLFGVGLVLVLSPGKKPVPTPGTQFPGASTTPVTNTTTRTISTEDGGTMNVADFVNNGISFEDPSNPGNYYLAGSNGICTADGKCPRVGTQMDFNIIYFADDNSFVIGILKEPLGAIRKEAEQSLMVTLGITSSDMCKLKYTIGTTSYVSDTYGGKNLGFSFCAGATKLP